MPKTSLFFTDVSNQKAVLERSLRSFSALTNGDTFKVFYNEQEYEIEVRELEPCDAVSVVNCDMNLDIEAPEEYKRELEKSYEEARREREVEEGERRRAEDESEAANQEIQKKLQEYARKNFRIFGGSGRRIDGVEVETNDDMTKVDLPRGVPNYEWEFGTLNFIRGNKPPKKEAKTSKILFKAFSGSGNILKPEN